MIARMLVFAVLITQTAFAAGTPVLVELFTSEGCSSCPPADLLLRRLEKEQPVAGAEIIVLSEHVDYWNHLGWRDPFSSADYSSRQQNYARRFHRDGPYTPQMVVNGDTEFIGSDAKRARQAIGDAAKQLVVSMRLQWTADSKVQVDVDGGAKADVYLVTARDEAFSDVTRGENSGRKLGHVSVAGRMMVVGKVSAKAGFSKALSVDVSAGRVIAFLQSPDQGKILGSAILQRKQ